MDRAEFEADLRRDGYRVVNTSVKPNLLSANHCHDFDAKSFVLGGEITITRDNAPATFRAGQCFEVPMGCMLGVPSPAFCWLVWAILGQASGAYVGPTCWAVLFLSAAAAVLHQRGVVAVVPSGGPGPTGVGRLQHLLERARQRRPVVAGQAADQSG